MNMYGSFADVYDLFMEDTPYRIWADYIETIWREYQCQPKLVLDLACGTGSITQKLWERGYDMIGVDSSPDMLSQAAAKAAEKAADILYLSQDMRELELYGTVDAAICLCDGMNYLLEESDLTTVCKRVNTFLNPGGLFIFDMNTEYKYRHILSDNTFAYSNELAAYIWENSYDESSGINEYDIQCFFERADGLYERFAETHYQRAYSIQTVTNCIARSGLTLLRVCQSPAFQEPAPDSERIYFITQLTVKT